MKNAVGDRCQFAANPAVAAAETATLGRQTAKRTTKHRKFTDTHIIPAESGATAETVNVLDTVQAGDKVAFLHRSAADVHALITIEITKRSWTFQWKPFGDSNRFMIT